MPKGKDEVSRASGKGGRRPAREDGRVSKPHCARSLSLSSTSGNTEPVEPTPGPSVKKSRPNSLKELLKTLKMGKPKSRIKLSLDDKKVLAELRQQKEVSNFKMPDSPKSKKTKRNSTDTRVWVPCPLLPGVPTVPPPRKPQPWELKDMPSRTSDSEIVPDARTPPPKKKRQLRFTPSPETIDNAETPLTPELDDIEFVEPKPGFTLSPQTPELADIESVEPKPGSTLSPKTPELADIEAVEPKPGSTLSPKTPEMADIEAVEPTPCYTVTPQDIMSADVHFADLQPCHNVTSQDIMAADVRFVGILPSGSTSTTTADSGKSAYEMDLEQVFTVLGEGSDIECEESLFDIDGIQRNVNEYPVDSDSLTDLSLADAVLIIDAEADSALRTVLDPEVDQDLLSFDWRGEPENFEGVREDFTVPSTGPIFETADLTPLDIFLKIWDADIIEHIVRETNRYAHEIIRLNTKPKGRILRWTEITDTELKKFFAVIMLQSLVINNVEKEYWNPKLSRLRIGNFGAIMTYDRFLLIKRCLHFVDNASLPVHPNRLHKIVPIIDRLNKKFKSLYVLEQNISLDESLLLWKGRLSFGQKIQGKRAKVGIKSYELCESRTGYLWNMLFYGDKRQAGDEESAEDHKDIKDADDPEGATSQIVLTLMRPLFKKGHTLVMDNFYNSPLLSRLLKVKHKTDTMGTLRLTREFVPEGLKIKSKLNMKPGEVAFSSTKDLSVLVWKDNSVVAMISTFHKVEVGGIEKYGYYKYKPKVILDYNLTMGGVDRKDQMLASYPVERSRNTIWYKKLFRRLLNVSIHNSFVMFNHKRTPPIGNREFRLQLVEGILQMCELVESVPAPPVSPSQMHLPAKNKRSQRCKVCAAAKVRRTTMWRCSTCAVHLCLLGCYTDYHTAIPVYQNIDKHVKRI